MTSQERAEQVVDNWEESVAGFVDPTVERYEMMRGLIEYLVAALDAHAAERLRCLTHGLNCAWCAQCLEERDRWVMEEERGGCAQYVEFKLCSAPLGTTAPCRRCRACQVAAMIRARGQA